MTGWRRKLLIGLALALTPTGCILPSSRAYKSGRMVVQKARQDEASTKIIEAGYAYPDINLAVSERNRKEWMERLGAPVLEGRFQYDLWADTTEIIMGPLLFTVAFGDAFFGLLALEFHQESFEKLLFLPAAVPLFIHRDMSAEAGDFEDTGRIRWRSWKAKKKVISEPLAEKTVNIVAEDGTILYQAITNDEGEAYINVRDAFRSLFRDGLKPARAVELVSGKSCELSLNPERIRREALAVGDPDPALE